MNILEVKNVSFSYDGDKYVLSDINMKFEEGKLYGIYGKSGAGKSTMLSLLAGLEKTKIGDILYDGKDIDGVNRELYRSSSVGMIFQSYNLLPQYTALENVLLSMNIGKIKTEDNKKRAQELLDKVGIDKDKANRRILMLSGGEQQRVAIARAISCNSKIILADEPTGNLDKENEDAIIEILKNIAHKEKKCVIIVTHSNNMKEAVDTLYHLKNGKLID